MGLMASSELRSLFIPVLLLAILYVISIVFFHTVEKWNFLDAAYYTTVTITTVGYGDFVPVTALGKLGAMVLIFTGVSLGLYIITHLGVLRERTIDPHVQRRLEMLRNLTILQTGEVRKDEIKRIKEKMSARHGDEKKNDFGRL
jgi:voltage-gated potassium channel